MAKVHRKRNYINKDTDNLWNEKKNPSYTSDMVLKPEMSK